MKMKFNLYGLIFVSFCNQSVAQSVQKGEPQVKLYTKKSSIKKDSVFFLYKVNITEGISLHKEIINTSNCDKWFSDVVLLIEKFDNHEKKYVLIPCMVDISPALNLSGESNDTIFIKHSVIKRQLDYFDLHQLPKNNYRLRIKFYYLQSGVRKFTLSNYCYLKN